VEQKYGWAGTQVRVPTYLGIRDVSQRVVEFLLALDALGRAGRMAELRQQESRIREQWASSVSKLVATVSQYGVELIGVSRTPTMATAATTAQGFVDIDGQRFELLEAIEQLSTTLRSFEFAEPAGPPTTARVAPGLEIELTERERELQVVILGAHQAEHDAYILEHQRHELDRRIADLSEERQRFADILLLRELGSLVAAQSVADHRCPTCNQSLGGIEVADGEAELDVGQNRALAQQQVEMLRDLRDSTDTQLQRVLRGRDVIRIRASEVRERVRSLKDTLAGPNSAVSEADIVRRVLLRSRVSQRKMQLLQ
jgi:hypothetical protein